MTMTLELRFQIEALTNELIQKAECAINDMHLYCTSSQAEHGFRHAIRVCDQGTAGAVLDNWVRFVSVKRTTGPAYHLFCGNATIFLKHLQAVRNGFLASLSGKRFDAEMALVKKFLGYCKMHAVIKTSKT